MGLNLFRKRLTLPLLREGAKHAEEAMALFTAGDGAAHPHNVLQALVQGTALYLHRSGVAADDPETEEGTDRTLLCHLQSLPTQVDSWDALVEWTTTLPDDPECDPAEIFWVDTANVVFTVSKGQLWLWDLGRPVPQGV